MQKFLIILGTSREGNYSQYAAKLVKRVIDERDDCEAELIIPAEENLDLKLESQGDKYPQLQQKIKAADGYVIVTPEYNHGYPATIKFILDLFKSEYKHKPAGLIGVSSGNFGGARAVKTLLGVLKNLSMVAIRPDVNFTNIQKEAEDGTFQDEKPWRRRINSMLDELVWMSATLKTGRQSDSVDH